MMPMRILLLIFLSPILSLGGAAKPIGTVKNILGTVYLTQLPEKTSRLLKKGDAIYLGIIIKTSKNARVTLALEDGLIKIIPENTTTMFLDEKSYEWYKKTDQSIQKIFSIIGKKAAPQTNPDSGDRQSVIQSFYAKNAFEEVLLQASLLRNSDWTPALYFMAGVSALRSGLERKALEYFKALEATDSFEFRLQAREGLFFSYLRLQQLDDARAILQTMNAAQPRKSALRSLLDEAAEPGTKP